MRHGRLTAIADAVGHYCALADKHSVFLEKLAWSLTSQGIRLTELDNFDAALAADREAVSLYIEVFAHDPVQQHRDSLEQSRQPRHRPERSRAP
jgi:hypothetical protein